MNLFNDEGHLTKEGLEALVGEQLDEMGRLEAAEHLEFCMPCMELYLEALSGVELKQPEEPVPAQVKKRIRRKGIRVAFSRYATVAAAACLVAALWGSGFFASIYKAPEAQRERQQQMQQEALETAQEPGGTSGFVSETARWLASGVGEIFDSMRQPGQPGMIGSGTAAGTQQTPDDSSTATGNSHNES